MRSCPSLGDGYRLSLSRPSRCSYSSKSESAATPVCPSAPVRRRSSLVSSPYAPLRCGRPQAEKLRTALRCDRCDTCDIVEPALERREGRVKEGARDRPLLRGGEADRRLVYRAVRA